MGRVAAALLAFTLAGCGDADRGPPGTVTVTISGVGRGAGGVHQLHAEPARTAAAQARGLMFRRIVPPGGMLFWPYPPDGGPPRDATFWMKDTPAPLDILFIRADGAVARIARNTTPLSETPIPSGGPVAAVLELRAGAAAELGLAEGDRASWPGRP